MDSGYYMDKEKGFRESLRRHCEGSPVYSYLENFLFKGRLPSYDWVINEVFRGGDDLYGKTDRDYHFDMVVGACRVTDTYLFLSNEFVDGLAETIRECDAKRVVEIGAGDGFLSYFLGLHGIDIVATDNYCRPFIKHRDNVKKIGHLDALRDFNPDLVLMCWEDYLSTCSVDVLSHGSIKELLWIGESPVDLEVGSIGCTGSVELWGYDHKNIDNQFCVGRSCYWNIYELMQKSFVYKFFPIKTNNVG